MTMSRRVTSGKEPRTLWQVKPFVYTSHLAEITSQRPVDSALCRIQAVNPAD